MEAYQSTGGPPNMSGGMPNMSGDMPNMGEFFNNQQQPTTEPTNKGPDIDDVD